MQTDKPKGAEQILCVDDDEVFTHVLSRAFSKRGFIVHTAADCRGALSLAAREPIDRALVDLKLDDESGLPLIPQLKTLRPELAIVVLTGYSSIATAVEAIKLGATNYLCKPADANEILAAFDCAGGDPEMEINPQPPSLERLEWEHIQMVLGSNKGNISATARALGMHRRTLQRKLQKRPVRR